ncbi:MAG: hypothetical protein ACI85O_003071 [Saprospiraceae bacterium]|jgi:hypothetical protein
MAKPNLKFKNVDDPYRIRCGERRILTMEIKARAAGICKLTLFLKAATCVFAGGDKEITVEFEADDASQKRELDIQLVMMGSRKMTYTLNLNAKVENAEGDKNDDFLLVKLDCRNPMSEEEQTVIFEEAPLTEVTTPMHDDDVDAIDEEEENTDTDENADADVVDTDSVEEEDNDGNS